MIVEHDQAVPMIEQIAQNMNALLGYDLIEGPLCSKLIEQTIIEQNSIMI